MISSFNDLRIPVLSSTATASRIVGLGQMNVISRRYLESDSKVTDFGLSPLCPLSFSFSPFRDRSPWAWSPWAWPAACGTVIAVHFYWLHISMSSPRSPLMLFMTCSPIHIYSFVGRSKSHLSNPQYLSLIIVQYKTRPSLPSIRKVNLCLFWRFGHHLS